VSVVALVLGVVGCLGGSSRSFLVFPWRGLLGRRSLGLVVALVLGVSLRCVGPWRWSLAALVLGVGPWHWSLALVGACVIGPWCWLRHWPLVLVALVLGVGPWVLGAWPWLGPWRLLGVGCLGPFVSVGRCVGPWRGGLLGSVVVVALVLVVS
jgi:hypothetical protein